MSPAPISNYSARRSPLTPVFIFILLSILAPACSKPKDPPAAVKALYQQDAARLCEAITECIKQDVEVRLKNSPHRRKMVLSRMNKDLCLQGQFALVGRLSVNPWGKKPVYNPEHYRWYSACSKAVSAAENCESRRSIHKTFPDCVNLRKIYNQDESPPTQADPPGL